MLKLDNCFYALCVATVLGLTAGAARSQDCSGQYSCWNFDPPIPTTAPSGVTGLSDFTLILPGNQLGDSLFYNASPFEKVDLTYNGATNETTFEITPGQSGSDVAVGSTGYVHFGVSVILPGQSGGHESLIPPTPTAWSYVLNGVTGYIPIPSAGVRFNDLDTSATPEWLVEYIDAKSDGLSNAEWFEFEFHGSYTQALYGDMPGVQVYSVKSFVSPTEYDLDKLNGNYFPPTYAEFVADPDYPDGTPLETPEPASWAMIILGIFGLGLTMRRARGSGRAGAVSL